MDPKEYDSLGTQSLACLPISESVVSKLMDLKVGMVP